MHSRPRIESGEVRTRGRAAKIATALVVCASTIALLDVALRAALNDSVYQIAMPDIPELSRFTSSTAEDAIRIGNLGGATKAIDDDVPRRIRTVIDSFGFRNDATVQGPFDLIVLGDSFGFGIGTAQEKTFPSLLRDRGRWSVYNLSMPYTGPWGEFVNLSLESRRLTLRPGAVVLWAIFSANDLDDRYGTLDVDHLPRNGPIGRTWIRVKRFRNRSPIYQLVQRAKRALGPQPPVSVVTAPFLNGRPALFVQEYSDLRRRTADDIVRHANYTALVDTIAATKQLTDRLGAALKMVFIPSKEEVYGWMLDKAEPWSTPAVATPLGLVLRELCARAGIDYLDVTPRFVVASRQEYLQSGDMLWWYDDTHWNERGHELAATVIHDELLARHDKGRSVTDGGTGAGNAK